MGAKAICPCGAEWYGFKLEHCTVAGCHRTFSSTRAGDMHRTGDHAKTFGPDRRRCKTDDEMNKSGLVARDNGKGLIVWGRAGSAPRILTAAVSAGSTHSDPLGGSTPGESQAV